MQSKELQVYNDVVVFDEGQVKRTESRSFTAGSCSDVWKVDYNGSPVAIKVYRGLPYVDGVKEQFWNLLMKEVTVWSKLSHANVVPLIGVTNDFGHLPGLVLPMYKNSNLNKYLSTHPHANRVQLLLDVAHGLHYLHTFKTPVYHGELKASNIMIDDDGRALIGDIGQATLTTEMVFTRANCCGSCRWCAPELMIPEPDFDIYRDKSDVYSFAMLMLETFTGMLPFSYIRPDAKVIFDVIKGIRPKRPTVAEAPQLTDELWKLMTDCWDHDQLKRPSAGEVFCRLYAIHRREQVYEIQPIHIPAARL
ncbi:kinase-like protein [Schizopora paradoxa]|uniref:Kinase-like protein n=1 Tax=Schizopora paradoxa TaxID=27342 RepID=A0A0H2RZC3_9AGAM|nr:kinase-like protein [Schizopora paradoxa]